MAMSAGAAKGVKAEPNVTPMIDVMLVLLIIFMLVIPAINAGFTAVPPQGQNLQPKPEQDDDQVLGIDAHGQYYLNKQPIPNASLGEHLNSIFSARTVDKVLYVKADKNLAYGKILDALDIAAHNQVALAGMITDQQLGTISKIASDRLVPGLGGNK